MKKIACFLSLVLWLVTTGCAASGTQSQLAANRHPLNNASTLIKVTNQQVQIIKNTQQFSGTVQKPAQ